MATTRIMPLHVGKGRTESRVISDIIDYVANPQKTDNGKLITSYACDSRTADAEFLLVNSVAIDNALSQSPADFEELLKLLQEYGCEVSKRGKSYRLKLSGWEKAARMGSLGEGYGLDDLWAVLSGKKAHTPQKKTVAQAEPPKVNLLVDIQAKLQAGKGAGYARWAKVFNLKQMAQTMNYLSEFWAWFSTGLVFLIVTHNLAQAKRIADDVAFFQNGRLVETKDAETFWEKPECEETKEFLKG